VARCYSSAVARIALAILVQYLVAPSMIGDRIMPNDGARKSPNDILAEQIVSELSDAGLIPDNRKADLESKLKIGGVNQDDWNLWIDLATAPDRVEEDNDE